MLLGDYLSLRQLHTVLHEVSDAAEHLDSHEALLSLAYEVRKAYEGQRESFLPSGNLPEIGQRFGVKLLWPSILYQCSLLRTSLKYFDSSRTQQGITYLLESLINDGLRSDFPAQAPDIIKEWNELSPCSETGSRLPVVCGIFCLWSNQERREKLKNLMKSFSRDYDAIYSLFRSTGATDLIHPSVFQDGEWPDVQCDPRW